MRFAPETLAILIDIAKTHFGDGAVVRLFGSRVNDSAVGGDIDIHVSAPHAQFIDEVAFLAQAERLLDEKVDLRVQTGEMLLIDKVARNEGVLLSGGPR